MAGDERIGLDELVARAEECWVNRVVLREERQGTDRIVWRGWLSSLDSGQIIHFSEAPVWADFCAVCDLAEQLDALLDVLDRDGVPLARPCRNDLDALPVLADWCDDTHRPRAAAEVRHLHSLVRHFRAALRASPSPLVLWASEGWQTEFDPGYAAEQALFSALSSPPQTG